MVGVGFRSADRDPAKSYSFAHANKTERVTNEGNVQLTTLVNDIGEQITAKWFSQEFNKYRGPRELIRFRTKGEVIKNAKENFSDYSFAALSACTCVYGGASGSGAKTRTDG